MNVTRRRQNSNAINCLRGIKWPRRERRAVLRVLWPRRWWWYGFLLVVGFGVGAVVRLWTDYHFVFGLGKIYGEMGL